jgi:5-formyltetrahydrofolate cyclo-ligase
MTKAELREVYLAKRKQLAPGQLQNFSDAICELVFTHFQLEDKYVSLFLPIERHHEINTYRIWEKAVAFGAHVGVPKANFETLEMKHIQFESEDQLELSAWGIPEPSRGKIIPADKFDIVFVPLVTADIKGYRVGYGKGFYDNFLKKCTPNCLFVGLYLFDFVEKIDDVHPGDVRLHACITPTGLHRFE